MVCWLLFHSHHTGYRRFAWTDLQTEAQSRVKSELQVHFKVGKGVNSKTCVQRLFTRLISNYRYEALKTSVVSHGTRITAEDPLCKRRVGGKMKHVMKLGEPVTRTARLTAGKMVNLAYYIGKICENRSDTIVWELVSRVPNRECCSLFMRYHLLTYR